MTVPQKTYTDQTGALNQYFSGLIGKSGTVQGDPGAIDALRQILGTQMGQMTPEGLSALIGQIFAEGGKQVPVIATQYGQAVGARTGNNSGIKIANAQLQEQLARKSFDMILQAQNNAANTAGVLGKLNQTTTEGSANPWLQALMPFAPSLIGKGAKMLKFGENETSSLGGSQTTGVFGTQGVGTGYGFNTSDFSADYGGMDVGVDFGAGGGFASDGGYGMGYGSDGIDIGDFGVDSSIDYVDGFEGFDLGFADGGLVSRKKLMASRNKKPKGYANGGQVTSVGGIPEDVTDVTGRPVRGVNYNGPSGDPLLPLVASMNGMGSDTGGRGFVAPVDPKKDTGIPDQNDGPSISVPSVVGTPDENAAAIAGMVGMAVATALGIPSAVPGLAMSVMGIPNSSMSPTGKAFSLVQSLISQTLGLGQNPDEGVAPPTEGGMSTVGPTGAGMSTTAAMSAPSVTAESLGITADSGIDGATGIGAGDSSSGGTDGIGDAASAGVGGGGFKKGGKVDGPGSETSDSIPILVSDNEYVLNAEATEMFLPVIEMMNALGLEKRGGAKNGAR